MSQVFYSVVINFFWIKCRKFFFAYFFFDQVVDRALVFFACVSLTRQDVVYHRWRYLIDMMSLASKPLGYFSY